MSAVIASPAAGNRLRESISPPESISLVLLGYGRVGQAVAAVAAAERPRLARAGVSLSFDAALVRDREKPRAAPPIRLLTTSGVIYPNFGKNDTLRRFVVEVMGGLEPARALVARALEAGLPVVTANKTLVAHHGRDLAALAARRGAAFFYDAAVLAGVPFIGSLSRRPLIAAARRLEGVINGTSHFIVNAIEAGASFDSALAEATARGYAEPDSSADVTGRDAAEKLTILLHLTGHHGVRVADLTTTSLRTLAPQDFDQAHQLGGTIKPVAIASLDPASAGAWVGPAFVPGAHPFARLDGVTNALRLIGSSGRDVLFAGPGAGPEATAITILDDVVEIATGGLALAPNPYTPSWPDGPPLTAPPPGRWWIAAGDGPAKITGPTPWHVVQRTVAEHASRGARALALPVLETN